MAPDRRTEELQRVLSFMRGADAGASTLARRLPFGTAYFHEDLPDVWDRNFILVEWGAPETDAASLAKEAEELQGAAGLLHRKLVFEDQAVAARFAPQLTAGGWAERRLSVMVHRSGLGEAAVAVGDEASEVDRKTLEPAVERLLRAELYGNDGDAARQLMQADVPLDRLLRQRCFARLVRGQVASYCRLYSHDHVAQVEDVATLPHWRGRGFARAVVTRALVEAGPDHELTFLTAVDGRWVERWYERLGFEEIALRYEFTRQA